MLLAYDIPFSPFVHETRQNHWTKLPLLTTTNFIDEALPQLALKLNIYFK